MMETHRNEKGRMVIRFSMDDRSHKEETLHTQLSEREQMIADRRARKVELRKREEARLARKAGLAGPGRKPRILGK